MTYRPIFVSEREVAHTHLNGAADNAAWEDCVFCSGLMLANAAKLGQYPATLVEAENIRDAAGASATGSTTNNQLNLGLSRRYGWTGKRVAGGNFPGFLAAVPVGYATAFAGSFANFPVGHRLRRFQPNYVGGHEVFAIHEGLNTWWWMDPLGPKDGSYQGEPVTDADIRTFYIGNSDGGTVMQVGTSTPKWQWSNSPERLPDGALFDCRGIVNVWDPNRPGGPVGTITGSIAIRWRVGVGWLDGVRRIPNGFPFDQISAEGHQYFNCLVVEADGAVLIPAPSPVPPPVAIPVPPVYTTPIPDSPFLPEPEPLPNPIPAPFLPVPDVPDVPEPESVPIPPPTPLPSYVPPTPEQIGQIIGGGVTEKPGTSIRRKNITHI